MCKETEYLEIPWLLRQSQNKRRKEMRDQTRNLNPHKAARVAMYLYGHAYAAQRGGSMDFWDDLPEGRKNVCRKLVAELADTPDEEAHNA